MSRKQIRKQAPGAGGGSRPWQKNTAYSGRKKMHTLIGSAALLLLTAPAFATETNNYTYDAQGRLVKIEHSGSVNNNVKSEYEHDKSDNRTRKKVTGA
jgi:hypothetical protein